MKTLLLFRCTEKKYADTFCKYGSMKFNTPKYWIELEEKEGKGRGDSLEGVYLANNFLNIEELLQLRRLRNNVYTKTINGIVYNWDKDVFNLPCYCLFGLNNTMFHECKIDERGVKHYPSRIIKKYFEDFCNNTTKESVEQLSDEEKPTLVIINNPHEFFERIRKYFFSIGVKEDELIISPVQYINKDKSFCFNGVFPYELLLKDESFSYQSEVRIILNTKNKNILKVLSDSNNIINIGNLEDITEIKEFYYDDMILEIQGNKLLYSLPKPETYIADELPIEEILGIMYGIISGISPKECYGDKEKTLNSLEEILIKKHNVTKLDWDNMKCWINDEEYSLNNSQI
ncbi:MAG: hypothetical protein E6610_07500 [Clostridium perfringens]|nr:hypothetical protein [Clostridium perfringens]